MYVSILLASLPAIASAASAQPSITWVKLGTRPNVAYEAPSPVARDSRLGLLLSEAPPKAAIRVSAYREASTGSSIDITRLDEADLLSRIRVIGSSRLVALPPRDWSGIVQLEAQWQDHAGKPLGPPYSLTLDAAKAAAWASPALASLWTSGSNFVRRLGSLYDALRDAPERRRVFELKLGANGDPDGGPKPRGDGDEFIDSIAVSAGGKAAWISRSSGGAVLWRSRGALEPEAILRAEPLRGITFVDDDTLVAGQGPDLLVVQAHGVVGRFPLAAGDIVGVYSARRDGNAIEVVLETAAPGSTIATAYSARLAPGESRVMLERRLGTPLYRARPALAKERTLFIAGTENDIPGIHAVSLPGAAIRTVARCASPGIVAASPEGTLVAFSAVSCAP